MVAEPPALDFGSFNGTVRKDLTKEFRNQRTAEQFSRLLEEKNRLIDLYRHTAGYAEDLRSMRDTIEEKKKEAVGTLNKILLEEFNALGIKFEEATWDTAKNKEGKPKKRALTLKDIEVLHPFHWGYGRGFTEKNLHRMVQFAEAFQDEEIVATLWRQLSWSHFRELLPLKKPLQREFYAEMCRIEGWSVRTLSERIDSMLYERTALSRKPEELIRTELDDLRAKGALTTSMLLKDPYILDFLGLNNRYVEKDLEDAILSELETFILELGAGFSFVARQKRLQIDGDDFYIDLLFYNRRLRRLVDIELKIGRFKHAYKSQMELYLRWLDKYEREADELSPLGIILCAEKNSEQVELLELDASGIHVAEYLTVLPSRDVLHERLQTAIKSARARFNNGSDNQ